MKMIFSANKVSPVHEIVDRWMLPSRDKSQVHAYCWLHGPSPLPLWVTQAKIRTRKWEMENGEKAYRISIQQTTDAQHVGLHLICFTTPCVVVPALPISFPRFPVSHFLFLLLHWPLWFLWSSALTLTPGSLQIFCNCRKLGRPENEADLHTGTSI